MTQTRHRTRRSTREPSERGPGRRWAARISVVAIAAVLVLVGLGAVSGLALRSELETARRQMLRGRGALLRGDATAAAEAFAAARAGFADAAERARGGALGLARVVPVLGRTPDAVVDLSTAGRELAAAGEEVASSIAALPDGVGSLAPRNGEIPLETVASFGDEVARAESRARTALATVQAAPTSLLLPPLSGAREVAEDEARAAHDALLAARRLLEGLPAFLGDERPARYFFVAQNPAEQRGTGGIMGAFSILEIEDGRFRFTPFRGVQTLPTLDPEVVGAPSEDYARNYDQYGGAGFLLNVNMTPDFPSAAQAILLHRSASTGEELDGVVAADPFALAALLEVTGPAEVPGFGFRVDAEDVVAFTTNRAYGLLGKPAERKAVLGAVAQAVFDRFLRGSSGGQRKLRALAETAAAGHVLVYSVDPRMQEGLELAGVAGSFRQGPPAPDLFGLVVNNGAGNKVDFYERREAKLEVRLGGDRSADSTIEVTTENEAPSRGAPKYVLGPVLPDAAPGENITILNVYCAPGCELQSSERDGRRLDLPRGSELGYPFYRDYYRVVAGGSSTLRLQTSTPDAWTGNSSGGAYRIVWAGQTVIRPTEMRIEVHAPPGMRFVDATPSVRVAGSTAIWTGDPGRRLELEMEFSPPAPIRWWRNVTRLLSRPVIRL